MILIICYDKNTDITIYNYCRLFNSIFIFFLTQFSMKLMMKMKILILPHRPLIFRGLDVHKLIFIFITKYVDF